jgi:creatinine amidohydrolase
MRLDHMAWTAVEQHLASGRRGIIVPLGSLEQHGAPGLIGTDAICAEAVAGRAAALAGGLVAPVLAYGQAQFNLGFPGTISLRPSVLAAVLADIIISLGHGGFTRVLLLTGHGGNVAPAQVAIQEVMAEISLGRLRFARPLHVKLRAWWDGPRVAALRRDLYGEREGFHATPSEIAIAMALHPHLAAPPGAWPAFRALPADPLLDHGLDRHENAARHRARFPDGLIGSDPALARAEHGTLLLDAAAADVAEAFAAFATAPDAAPDIHDGR